MKNNFTFCASIKLKELEKMENLIDLFYKEHISDDDFKICISFRNMLDSFENNPKMNDLINTFAEFYDEILYPYCRLKMIVCKTFEEFDFEEIQYVMDKMKEVINILYDSYGMR